MLTPTDGTSAFADVPRIANDRLASDAQQHLGIEVDDAREISEQTEI